MWIIFILDLQKGNPGVATVELQRGPDKNFERRNKASMKKQMSEFSVRNLKTLGRNKSE